MASDKLGAKVMTVAGLLFMGSGFFLMSRLGEHTPIVSCAAFVSVISLGQALFQPANNAMIMSACPREKLGIAGSISSLVRNLGQIIGITLSTTLLYYFMSIKLSCHVSDFVKGRDDVFVFGMRNVYLILMVICWLGALFTILGLYRTKKKTEQPVGTKE